MLRNFITLRMLIVISCLVSVNCYQCYQCRSDLQKHCRKLEDEEYLLDCLNHQDNSTLLTQDSTKDVTKDAVDVNATEESSRRKKDTFISKDSSKLYCRKVVQSIYFVKKRTSIVIRECADGIPSEYACTYENLDQFELLVCECRKAGCNLTSRQTIPFWLITFLLCLRFIFPP